MTLDRDISQPWASKQGGKLAVSRKVGVFPTVETDPMVIILADMMRYIMSTERSSKELTDTD